jgi:hypothetical protein
VAEQQANELPQKSAKNAKKKPQMNADIRGSAWSEQHVEYVFDSVTAKAKNTVIAITVSRGQHRDRSPEPNLRKSADSFFAVSLRSLRSFAAIFCLDC